MKRAVRKLLQVRPNTLLVEVKPFETDFAEFGKCKQNSYNMVNSDSDRFEFVTGWVVHEADGEHTIVHGHWWNYDIFKKEHIDSTQKFFNSKVSYVVDMEIGKILSKYEMSMGDERLNLLFDKHPQVIGDLLFYKDSWYAWDDEEQKVFHNFGKTIVNAQQLFAMDMMISAEKTMKPEVYNELKDYLKAKYEPCDINGRG